MSGTGPPSAIACYGCARGHRRGDPEKRRPQRRRWPGGGRPSRLMRLWRLTRAGHTALDGAGAVRYGGRYSPPGAPVVNFASEAGLAVLVALRYLPDDPAAAREDYVLGWTEIDAVPDRAPDGDEETTRAFVTRWLDERRSLLAAMRSRVLPEADVVMMNPRHPDAKSVPPLTTRPFSFAECLHEPPMLARYRKGVARRG